MKTIPPAADESELAASSSRELGLRLEFIDRLYTERFAARDLALTMAVTSMEKRLDSMNQFREALRDQAARYFTRDEYAAGHATVVEAVAAVQVSLSAYVVRVDEIDKTSAIDRAQLEKRLETMNEFRAAMKDQAGTFVTRSEVDAFIAVRDADIKRIEIKLVDLVPRVDIEGADARLDARLKSVETKLATWDGRLWALGTVFLLVNVFVSWFLSQGHVGHL